MPKKTTDYSKCVIYKIQHLEKNELLYVGHTTQFTCRKSAHKKNAEAEEGGKSHYKLYTMIRENGGWESFNMVIVTEYPCETKRQATTKEDEVMRELKATMNARHAGEFNYAVYAEENRERLRRVSSEWRDKNKEEIANKKKDYYEKNIEEIKIKRKEYASIHKEERNKYLAKYNEENKERVREYKRKWYLEKKSRTKKDTE